MDKKDESEKAIMREGNNQPEGGAGAAQSPGEDLLSFPELVAQFRGNIKIIVPKIKAMLREDEREDVDYICYKILQGIRLHDEEQGTPQPTQYTTLLAIKLAVLEFQRDGKEAELKVAREELAQAEQAFEEQQERFDALENERDELVAHLRLIRGEEEDDGAYYGGGGRHEL